MEAALEVAPEIRRCMSGYEPDRIVENAIHWKCAKLQFMKGHCTQAMIDKAHANGIRCNFFWSDDPAEARQLLESMKDSDKVLPLRGYGEQRNRFEKSYKDW